MSFSSPLQKVFVHTLCLEIFHLRLEDAQHRQQKNNIDAHMAFLTSNKLFAFEFSSSIRFQLFVFHFSRFHFLFWYHGMPQWHVPRAQWNSSRAQCRLPRAQWNLTRAQWTLPRAQCMTG